MKTAKLPVYAADDPYLAGFRAEAADDLPVLLLPVKKNVQLQTAVQPRTVKNKKTVLTVDSEELVQVRGNTLNGLKPGETVKSVEIKEVKGEADYETV